MKKDLHNAPPEAQGQRLSSPSPSIWDAHHCFSRSLASTWPESQCLRPASRLLRAACSNSPSLQPSLSPCARGVAWTSAVMWQPRTASPSSHFPSQHQRLYLRLPISLPLAPDPPHDSCQRAEDMESQAPSDFGCSTAALLTSAHRTEMPNAPTSGSLSSEHLPVTL